MSTDASWPLQEAIYTALTSSAAVQSLVADRVFDDAPQSVVFPYVEIGESTQVDVGGDDFDMGDHTLTMHIWSRQGGRKEIKQIMGAIYQTLHKQSVAVSGHTLINLRFDFSDTVRDDDGQTYHGIVRYRALTQSD